MMTRPLASITLAALLAALSSIEVSIAQAKQQCSAALPSDPHGQWWSYRIIDGRKCWYEGKPMLPKSSLEWPREVVARGAPTEHVVAAKPANVLDSQAELRESSDTFEARWRARVEQH